MAAKRVKADVVEVLGDLLVNAVARDGRWEVMSSTELNAILGLDKIKQTMGCDSLACAVELGGGFGADFLVTGSVGWLGAEIVISLMLVDVRNQRVLGRAQVRAPDDESRYADAIDSAIHQLFPNVTATPTVAAAPTPAPVALPMPSILMSELGQPAVFDAPTDGTMQVEFVPFKTDQTWQLVDHTTQASLCALPCKRWLKPSPHLILRYPTDLVGGAEEISVDSNLKVVPGLAVIATARPARGSIGLSITGLTIGSIGAALVLTAGPMWATTSFSSSSSSSGGATGTTGSGTSDTMSGLHAFGVWGTLSGIVVTAVGTVLWLLYEPQPAELTLTPATPAQ